MNCPQCRNSEISSALICLVCGYHLDGKAEITEEIGKEEAAPAIPSTPSTPSGGELPPWRQELSERLRAIRQDKESRKSALPAIAPVASVDSPQRLRNFVPQVRKTHSEPKSRTPAPQQKLLTPIDPKDPKEVERLIDKAVRRKPVQSSEDRSSGLAIPVSYEDKLILLSRTLSGLIDLMLITLCAGIFIIASDYFSGIIALDSFSFAGYAALFLLIYLIYSIFFLAASTQTIGMMITDLRLVGNDGKRPFLYQIIGRCCVFLLSLFGLGIGLAWSLFNSESSCFHDLISRTRVIRV
jgi:uncharacterized RDD family membrane protein YckC